MSGDGSFEGFVCADCARAHDERVATGRCPACGGPLAGEYDLARDGATDARAPFTAPPALGGSMYRYDALLPVDRSEAVSLGEGATPIVDAAALAAGADVDRVVVKDEGQNPTGTTADRGVSLLATAAQSRGADQVALASAGDDGQSVAAYAARAGIDARVFVPSRAGFVRKAMVNVHGAEMEVVGGRLADAIEAFEAAQADRRDDEHPRAPAFDCSPAATPYRVEGARTVLFELVEQLAADPDTGATAPDAVVVPSGTGVTLAGLDAAARQLVALGVLYERPALHAVQPAGCAPIVDAHEAAAERVDPVASPDTIVGELEVADPPVGDRALAAVTDTGGAAVAVEDQAALSAGAAVASRSGIEVGAAGAVGAAGVESLAATGHLDAADTVVVLNPSAGNKDGDVLRSHLMSRGI